MSDSAKNDNPDPRLNSPQTHYEKFYINYILHICLI